MSSFSVLMSVYSNENANFFQESLKSVLKQTLPPNQIVLVKDGPLTKDVEAVISYNLELYPQLFKIVSLKRNMGLGYALNEGLKNCSNEIVARMDTDDVAAPDRFEKQLSFLLQNQDVVLVGTNIREFINSPGDSTSSRSLPLKHEEIIKFSRKRNPFNHPSVMFFKEAILACGSYQPMYLFEDYYLWMRLIKRGYRTANLNESLTFLRIGNDMVGRRNGWKYIKCEIQFFTQCYKEELISQYDCIKAILLRVPVRLVPKKWLLFFYKKILRK